MQLSQGATRALAGLVTSLADNKHALGRRISEWAPGAPTLESAVACAALAQEELGHARVLYPVLQEISAPLCPDVESGGHCRVAFLDPPLPSWAHVVTALVLIDGALNTVMEALRDSAFAALARRVGRILDEERFHENYAKGQLLEAASYPQGGERLQEPVAELLPEMLCWFGPDGEDEFERLCREGLLAAGSEALRQAYLSRVGPLLMRAGLELPGLKVGTAGRWDYGELPWHRWDAARRRLIAKGSAQSAR